MAHNRWSIGSYENVVLSDSSTISPPSSTDQAYYGPYTTGLDSSYSDYASYYAGFSQLGGSSFAYPTTNARNNPPPSSGIIIPSNKKPSINPNIKAELSTRALWKKFSAFGTEMIITKSGRRLFPSLEIRVTGLEPKKEYYMFIDIFLADQENRYKYSGSNWVHGGKAELPIPDQNYAHPDNPQSGNTWMKETITFNKLKLTNSPYGKSGIVLHSMHKYLPRLFVVEKSTETIVYYHEFWEAQFIAVTAYQNENITKLKIEHNPFAKGFREGNNRKDYRIRRDEEEAENHYNRPPSNESHPNKRKSDDSLVPRQAFINRTNTAENFSSVKAEEIDYKNSANSGGQMQNIYQQQYLPYGYQQPSSLPSHIGQIYEQQLQTQYNHHLYSNQFASLAQQQPSLNYYS